MGTMIMLTSCHLILEFEMAFDGHQRSMVMAMTMAMVMAMVME